jgi:hypothetical protein
MTRFEEYKQQLGQHTSEFVAACKEVVRTPIPAGFDFGGLYYQVDERRMIPVSLSWITRDNRYGNAEACPFGRFEEVEWIWTDEDLDNCVHEDAEDYFFEWVSRCWIEAGGRDFSPLFVLADHGTMELLDLNTLKELSDEDIERRLSEERG